jgi:hypothetical protein
MTARSAVHIQSDGTPEGTVVTVNGTPVPGVRRVEWEANCAGRGRVTATLTVDGVSIEGDATLPATEDVLPPPPPPVGPNPGKITRHW